MKNRYSGFFLFFLLNVTKISRWKLQNNIIYSIAYFRQIMGFFLLNLGTKNKKKALRLRHSAFILRQITSSITTFDHLAFITIYNTPVVKWM
jgi:hypothetical protein